MAINNANDMNRINTIIGEMGNNKKTVKVIKKDNSLLERSEADKDKVILVEDNRQLLLG